jgi:hypothetical protein
MSQLVQGGVGDVIWVPNSVTAGISGPTPRRFGILQDVSVDFSGSTKELYGKNRVAAFVMDTELKVSGKAKGAQFKSDLFNMFFGAPAPTSGNTRRVSLDEAITPTGSGVATVAQAATFVEDLGVYDTITGLWNINISATGTPAAGQYKVSTGGVYTFFSTDTNPKQITYSYTVASGGGSVYFNIPNIAMGSGPRFAVVISNAQIDGKMVTIRLNKCLSNKLSISWKFNDWNIPEFDFAAMDDGTGYIGSINQDVAA